VKEADAVEVREAVRDFDGVRLGVREELGVGVSEGVAVPVAVPVPVAVAVLASVKSLGLPTRVIGSAGGSSGSLAPVSLLTVICKACTVYLR
jgi:hypothetical protein